MGDNRPQFPISCVIRPLWCLVVFFDGMQRNIPVHNSIRDSTRYERKKSHGSRVLYHLAPRTRNGQRFTKTVRAFPLLRIRRFPH